MKRIYILAFSVLIIIGCTKEKIVVQEVEKEYNWEKHTSFRYDHISQLNSYSNDERLYLLGISLFSSFVHDSLNHPDARGGNLAQYLTGYYLGINHKFPISSNFVILAEENNDFFTLKSTYGPIHSAGNLSPYVSNLDSNFIRFDFVHRSMGECMKINNNDQALIPYISRKSVSNILKLLLVDVRVPENAKHRIDTVRTRIITNEDLFYNEVYSLESFWKYFYLTTSDMVYRIDSEGNVKNVHEGCLFDFFEKDNVLHGLGYEYCYTSADSGLTWHKAYAIQPGFLQLTYTKINNRIIGYRMAQIFEIIPGESGLTAIELDNDGLIDHYITSISEFQDKIYVTTLSGVFTKEISEFFQEKQEHEE